MLTILAIASGCKEGISSHRPPYPTKDDLVLVNQQTMTMTDFIQLRTAFPKKTKEELIWMGSAALTLKDRAIHKKINLTKQQAFDIILFSSRIMPLEMALPSLTAYYGVNFPTPEQIKTEIVAALSSSKYLQNPLNYKLQ